MILRIRQRSVWPWVVALAALAGCSGFEFGEAVVGGDVSDRGPTPDGPDAGDLDAPDAAPDGDAPGDDLADAAPDAPDGAGRCASNAHCLDLSAPVCDGASGRCVQCTPSTDRCPRGQFCNATTLSCADGCRNDDDCLLPSTGDAGPGALRYCDVGRRVCVACRRDAECPSGLFCAGGECAVACSATRPCPAGQACCGGACADPRVNNANCGACGRVCALPNATPVCRAGACAVGACASPYGDCDGAAANGCETDLRSAANCGACDRACPVRPDATSACDGARGACSFACDPGFADCNARPEDGCEAELAADPQNCTACGARCAPANATPACAEGRCQVAACAPGWGDCDGAPASGCETDLRANLAHCGACRRACTAAPGATATCADGSCRGGCAPGLVDCNGRADDGCEVDTRADLLNCGACGALCRPANASGRCAAGACAVAACLAGFSDCNGRADDGCEVDLTSTPGSCGACGRACPAGQFCRAGACTADCGALTRCGAVCADLRSDAAHCGACGRACGAGQGCTAGTCAVVCRAPEVACGVACAVTATDRSHCGRCGNACPARANATPRCSAGACGFACNAGFADCDGGAANGCEVSTATDAGHCGGCNAVCTFANAGATCAAGACALGACAAGFGNCDAIPGNGCETALAADARHCGRCNNACATVCAAGACAPVVTINAPTVINTLAAPVAATAGSRAAMLVDAPGLTLPPGTRVILHQTQGAAAAAGGYELNRVVASAGASLMLETPLRFTYTTDTRNAHAQIVAVAQYSNLVVTSSGQLTAPEWNGRTGGVLALEASGAVTVQGSVTMNGRGFRGRSRDCSARNNCQYGFQGESWSGPSAQGALANGGGGGGGGQGQDCGAGGGGAYGAGATRGSPGDCNALPANECAPRCPNEGGAAGAAYGAGNPSGALHLGSAGGQGGADEDGGYPGQGGAGGGIVLLRAGGALSVTGVITSNGVDGLHGNQFACGGRGCGMGGGGGGSGGAIRLAAARATLGAGAVTATGGAGGQCSCRTVDIRRASPAGVGGSGRVSVSAPTVSGTTTPAYDPL